MTRSRSVVTAILLLFVGILALTAVLVIAQGNVSMIISGYTPKIIKEGQTVQFTKAGCAPLTLEIAPHTITEATKLVVILNGREVTIPRESIYPKTGSCQMFYLDFIRKEDGRNVAHIGLPQGVSMEVQAQAP